MIAVAAALGWFLLRPAAPASADAHPRTTPPAGAENAPAVPLDRVGAGLRARPESAAPIPKNVPEIKATPPTAPAQAPAPPPVTAAPAPAPELEKQEAKPIVAPAPRKPRKPHAGGSNVHGIE